jgi:pimeloyl-ACP methyl ester carboxylesterase
VIEPFVVGEGPPVTWFVGGLAQTVPDLRVFSSGLPGTRVLQPLAGVSAATLLDTLDTRRRALAPDQAVGVSLGAAALLSLAAEPGSLRRLVVVLPSVDTGLRPAPARHAVEVLCDALASRDQNEITKALLELQPRAVRDRPAVKMWARRQADAVADLDVLPLLTDLDAVAPPTTGSLERLTLPVLLLAQRDDPVHPVAVAQRLADLLLHAELVVSGVPWVWSARDRLRQEITAFLTAPSPSA